MRNALRWLAPIVAVFAFGRLSVASERSGVDSGFTMRNWSKARDIPAVKTYVYGIASGLSIANATLELDGQKQLYCQPDALALNAENVVQLIDKHLASEAGQRTLKNFGELPGDTPMFVLDALQSAFPCKR